MVRGAIGVAEGNAVIADAETAVGQAAQGVLDATVGQAGAVQVDAGHAGRDGEDGGVGAGLGDRILDIGFVDDGLGLHRVQRCLGGRDFRIEGGAGDHHGFDLAGALRRDAGGCWPPPAGRRQAPASAPKQKRQDGGGMAQGGWKWIGT